MYVHPVQVVVHLCLLYTTVQSTVVQYLYFKPSISRSKYKSSSDVAGTAKKHQIIGMETLLQQDLQEGDFIELLAVQHEKLTKEDLLELEAQRKDEERQEKGVTEDQRDFQFQGDFLYLRWHC